MLICIFICIVTVIFIFILHACIVVLVATKAKDRKTWYLLKTSQLLSEDFSNFVRNRIHSMLALEASTVGDAVLTRS